MSLTIIGITAFSSDPHLVRSVLFILLMGIIKFAPYPPISVSNNSVLIFTLEDRGSLCKHFQRFVWMKTVSFIEQNVIFY